MGCATSANPVASGPRRAMQDIRDLAARYSSSSSPSAYNLDGLALQNLLLAENRLLPADAKRVAENLIRTYATDKEKEHLTEKTLFTALLDAALHLFDPAAEATVYQDLDRPLAHYWVRTVRGGASLDAMRSAVLAGTRCVELRLRAQEGTLDRARDLLAMLRDVAFTTTSLPLLLVLDVHASEEDQNRLAEAVKTTLGPLLADMPLVRDADAHLPSPMSLAGRVVVLGTAGVTAESCLALVHMRHGDLKRDNARWKNYGELGFADAMGSERKRNGMARFSRNQLCRLYPDDDRIGSSNMDPVPGFCLGVQLCAMDPEIADEAAWLNAGLFRDNGAQGFVLKGRIPHVTDGKVRKPEKGERVTVSIIASHGLAADAAFAYVSVAVTGVAGDHSVHRTRAVKSARDICSWDEEFSFPISSPSLALLSFQVRDRDATSPQQILGQAVGRYPLVRPGIHGVQLFNAGGEPLPGRLLVRIATFPVI